MQKCIKIGITFTRRIETVNLMLILTFLSKLAAPWLMISISTAVSHKKCSCFELSTDFRCTCWMPSISTTYLWQQPYISSLTFGSEWANSLRITSEMTFQLLSSKDILKIKQHQTNIIEIDSVNYCKCVSWLW